MRSLLRPWSRTFGCPQRNSGKEEKIIWSHYVQRGWSTADFHCGYSWVLEGILGWSPQLLPWRKHSRNVGGTLSITRGDVTEIVKQLSSTQVEGALGSMRFGLSSLTLLMLWGCLGWPILAQRSGTIPLDWQTIGWFAFLRRWNREF